MTQRAFELYLLVAYLLNAQAHAIVGFECCC
jgi:hypothetical protein